MDPLAHASIALLARPLAPKAPLWALIAATQAPDALYFALAAAGVEKMAETRFDLNHGLVYLKQPVIPWSHGLTTCLAMSGATGGLTYLLTRDRRSSLVAGLMLFGHWLLDATVYPTMPVFFRPRPAVGLGLITSRTGFILGTLLELALVAGGVWGRHGCGRRALRARRPGRSSDSQASTT